MHHIKALFDATSSLLCFDQFYSTNAMTVAGHVEKWVARTVFQ